MDTSKMFCKALIQLLTLVLFVFFNSAMAADGPPVKTASSAKKLVSDKTYIIGAADVLTISVWKNSDLSVTVPVRPDGKISTPLVDDIHAGGLTPEALAAGITVRLAEFVRDPRVSVIVSQVNSNEYLSRVRVTGAVRNPISLPFRPGMTVLDVVLVAGGLTEFASANRSKLYRQKEQGTQVYSVKLKNILNKGKLDTNFILQPGDIITIPEQLL